jgi:hypothetical protein
LAGRRAILAIHSRRWQPPPAADLLDELAVATGGYCGADIKVRRQSNITLYHLLSGCFNLSMTVYASQTP